MLERTGIGLGGSHEPATPLLRTILGDRLRRIRLAQRRTLADVAADALVSMPYLSELERGRKEASSEVLAAICAALQVPLADLLTEVGRDLAESQARPPEVLRLDALRHRRPSPPASGTTRTRCQLAAA